MNLNNQKKKENPMTIELDPQRSGSCPACGGTDIRTKFADTDLPLDWCPDCMVGSGRPNGPVVDMHIFQSAIEQRAEIMRLRAAEKPVPVLPTYEELEAQNKLMRKELVGAYLYIGGVINRYEFTDDLEAVFDYVCDGLGLDESEEQDRFQEMSEHEMDAWEDKWKNS
jgi:hypothetical protein